MQNETTKLALKLAGIYVLIQAVLYIPGVLTNIWILFLGKAPILSAMTMLFTFGLLVISGLWLTISNKPKFDQKTVANTNLLPVSLAVGGVIIVSLAIVDLPFLATQYINALTSELPTKLIGINNNLENLMALVGNLIQLLFGALLFFKAKYFAQLIK